MSIILVDITIISLSLALTSARASLLAEFAPKKRRERRHHQGHPWSMDHDVIQAAAAM
jgi:hypothetical protein